MLSDSQIDTLVANHPMTPKYSMIIKGLDFHLMSRDPPFGINSTETAAVMECSEGAREATQHRRLYARESESKRARMQCPNPTKELLSR